MPFWLIATFVVIILVLLGIAAYYHWQLYQKQRAVAEQEKQNEQAIRDKQKKSVESVKFIARAYLSDQVELAEASLRISRLLDYIDISDEDRAKLSAFDQVAQRIAHIPILADWKALDKATKRKHQKTIADAEQAFDDFADDAAKHLLSIDFPH